MGDGRDAAGRAGAPGVSLPTDLQDLDPCAAARALLGWRICDGIRQARIVETEAYGGEDDAGSHAWRGPTPRTQIMYGEPGRAFIYFTYGSHWMLNCVCRPAGVAGAVLIRGAEPLAGLDEMRARRPKAKTDRALLGGPGCLAAAFGLSGEQNGADLFDPSGPLWLEPDEPPGQILVGVRVGLSPGRGPEAPRRFIDAGRRQWASPAPLRPPPSADRAP